jgi:hypothetical protein
MRISFDLDDTLICYQRSVPCEPRLPWYLKWLGGDEPLRLGARALLSELRERGWELWIYTTSYRDPTSVRLWLRCHGVRVAGVINQHVHESRFKRTGWRYPPSKNPSAFGITLHVDDSDGVRMEGDEHGFAVVVIAPEDTDWADKVRRRAKEFEPDRSP